VENNHLNPENDDSFGFHKDLDPGKRNVFTAPVNYFDKLPLEIADKIHSGRNNTAGVFRLSMPRLIGFATIIAVAITGSVFLYTANNSKILSEPMLSYNDLLNSELVSDLDETMLFEAYSESNDLSDNQNVQAQSEITELEDYLIENNTDITLIINEL